MITSSSNPTIKQIRALRQRKAREVSGRFFVEGIRLVAEALQLDAPIEQLIVAPDLLSSHFAHELLARQAAAGRPVIEVSGEVFASLSSKDGPQGLAAVVRQRWQTLDELQHDASPGYIALDAIADPGNLGAILRTADAVGLSGVILVGNCTDPYDPAALRASMGAIFALPLVRTEFTQLCLWAGRRGLPLVGTSDAAQLDFQAVTYQLPLILLMGSEREGLHADQQAACDLMVAIPMLGRSDSLNLAVSAGVMLYELLRQQRAELQQ